MFSRRSWSKPIQVSYYHPNQCNTCSCLLQTVISSIYTSKSFSLKQTITCRDTNIYCLKCNFCSKLYIGKTLAYQSLKDRHSDHIKSSCNPTKKHWPLFQHFSRHKTVFYLSHYYTSPKMPPKILMCYGKNLDQQTKYTTSNGS